jgi:hypothetical protein
MGRLVTGCLVAASALAAACATTTSSDDQTRNIRLPTGVALLESDRDRCAGSVQIENTSARSGAPRDIVVRQGQTATFAIDDDDEEVDWTCVGQSTATRESLQCPDATSHVRVTRTGAGEEFLFECYGRRIDR